MLRSCRILARSRFQPGIRALAHETHPGKLTGAGSLPNTKEKNADADYLLFHPVYTAEQLDVKVTHKEPASILDSMALRALNVVRGSFDFITGYGPNMTEEKYLTRMLFLETVAGVPGMCAAMWRHLQSLRSMKRDKGHIHTLLEEAENERMHLLTFMSLRKPGALFRIGVLGTQAIFWNAYFVFYVLAPRTAHRFVGYLEEEAVKTYTHCIEDLDAGKLPKWENLDAPKIAKQYWMLGEDAKMRDVLMAVRADEACHRHVNHTLADIGPDGANPFGKGSTHHD